jgi:hypothetical protein
MNKRAAYVPVPTIGYVPHIAGDYLTRRRETEGWIGERVETIDQMVELQRMPCAMEQRRAYRRHYYQPAATGTARSTFLFL